MSQPLPDPAPSCPRCSVPMEEGFLMDMSYGAVYPTAWLTGRPAWTWMLGVRTRGKEKLPIRSFRCPRCGLLESYAHPGEWKA